MQVPQKREVKRFVFQRVETHIAETPADLALLTDAFGQSRARPDEVYVEARGGAEVVLVEVPDLPVLTFEDRVAAAKAQQTAEIAEADTLKDRVADIQAILATGGTLAEVAALLKTTERVVRIALALPLSPAASVVTPAPEG